MIKEILIPTDGSDHADKAVDLAGDLASKYGARVHLLYVYSRSDEEQIRRLAEGEHLETKSSGHPGGALFNMPQAVFADIAGVSDRGLPASIYDKVGDMILSHAESVLKEKGVSAIRKTCTDGDPTDRILTAVKEDNTDMVIMGSRGLSDLRGLVVGSVSHKVSNTAPCTCVLVK